MKNIIEIANELNKMQNANVTEKAIFQVTNRKAFEKLTAKEQSEYMKANGIKTARSASDKTYNFLTAIENQAAMLRF